MVAMRGFLSILDPARTQLFGHLLATQGRRHLAVNLGIGVLLLRLPGKPESTDNLDTLSPKLAAAPTVNPGFRATGS